MAAAKRDEKGRFQIGNPGGPGRLKRQTEAGYLSVLMEACDLETWRGIVDRAVTDATDGNEKARSWLASYLVGAPSAEAPSTSTVVIQQLLHVDPALDAAAAQLAKPAIGREKYPILQADDEWIDAIKAEAAAAILAAEQTDAG
ncbi:hypothetical protein [uncultured Thiocystis sp.]|jgi:hypothetical protein|uniref:hypothetical protein n=1 Tax=uncultured Thiocystis sp. TaxID=1202134 RepID=UPI0025CBFB48|nr:hypothetical protein [uncultured Thiocystis sp.]